MIIWIFGFSVMLGVTSLLFWSLVTRAYAAPPPPGPPRKAPTEPPRRARVCAGLVVIAIIAVAAHFAWLAIRRQQLFLTFGYDLATMEQTMWNTAHGRWLESSVSDGEIVTRPLRGRVELVYLPVALLYRLLPTTETLLALQSVVLATSAAPLFLLARDRTGHSPFALILTLSYLLHPGLRGINLHSFHANAFAVPLILSMFFFLEREQYARGLFCAALTLACREDFGVLVFMVGLYVALAKRQPRYGLVMSGIGIGWLLTCIWLLPRLASHLGSPPPPPAAQAFTGHLAAGPLGLVRHYLSAPDQIVPQLLSLTNAFYLVTLLGPLAFLSLLAPRALIIVAPTLMVYVLSGWVEMTQVNTHYSANVLPVVAAVSALGAETYCRWSSARGPLALSFHIVTLTVFFLWLPDTRPQLRQAPVWSPAHQRALTTAVRQVRDEASVIATQHLMPHLAQRRRLVPWGPIQMEVDQALFDGHGELFWRGFRLPRHPQTLEVLSPYPDRFIGDPNWEVTWAEDGVVVMKKGASGAEREAGLRRLFACGERDRESFPSLRVGAWELRGARPHFEPALAGWIFRLHLHWRQQKGGTANVALVIDGGGARYAHAHTPTFGLTRGVLKPGASVCEELILILPALTASQGYRVGIAELPVAESSNGREGEIARNQVRNVQWCPHVLLRPSS